VEVTTETFRRAVKEFGLLSNNSVFMEKNYLKLSVVMAVYNADKYVREQLNSLVQQTYPIFELIIQDDDSTDQTMSILEEFKNKYPFVRVFRNKQRKGLNENFYSVMERATGDYIAITDADDVWETDKLEQQVRAIGDYWMCGGFQKPFSVAEDRPFDSRVPNYSIERIIHASEIGGCTMLFKREILPLILKYRTYPINYDHVIQLVVASFDQITFAENAIVNYRIHPNSITYTVPVMDPSGKKNRTLLNIVRSFFRTFILYLELRNKMHSWFKMIHEILTSLPVVDPNIHFENARKIALYRSQKGIIAYVKLTLVCVNGGGKYLFHVKEKNSILTLLRALYFPISCSDYFRYMSKSYKKNPIVKH
jgi:glycosyltransferase involved in cell wall biosynthesis